MRSIMLGAGPIKDGDRRYKNVKDDIKQQNEVGKDFQSNLRSMTQSGNEKYAAVRIRINGRLIFNIVFQETVSGDVAYAIFSFLFVFCYIWFHLGSFFIALLSMLMILMSFPVTYMIYTGVFQVTMNTTLNQLTIFIVLGIAADDIFVYCDAWKQSAFIKFIANDEKRRTAYAFKRSFRAILVTSSTTAVAFLANAMSDIRPIRAFGIFAAILIPVNFLLIITVMPSIQLVHDRYMKERCAYKKICCCCCSRCKKKQEVNAEPDKDIVSKFCGGWYNKIVFKGRYVFIVLFFIIGVVAAIIASNIGPLTEQEEFLPNSHELVVLADDIGNEFPSAADIKDSIVVSLNWGIKDLDRDDVDTWDPSDMGRLIWDDTFDLTPARNQEALLNLCKELKNESTLVKDSGVTCWLLDMEKFVIDDSTCSGGKLMPLVEKADFNKCFSQFL